VTRKLTKLAEERQHQR